MYLALGNSYFVLNHTDFAFKQTTDISIGTNCTFYCHVFFLHHMKGANLITPFNTCFFSFYNQPYFRRNLYNISHGTGI